MLDRGYEAMSRSILSSRSLYLQVRDALADRIAEGVWKPGQALTNESGA
jgi:DNA-binding GntR family transcriptional regulator